MTDQKKMAIVRMLVLGGMLLNSVLVHYGKSPIPVSEEFVYQMVSDFILIATAFYTAYKNNDFTKEAQLGTSVTRTLKGENVSKDTAENYMEAKKKMDAQ